MKRSIAIVFFLALVIGGLYHFLPVDVPLYKKPKEELPVQASIHNPQQLLLFFELTNEKNTLHRAWYDLINPIVYVVANGVMKSVTGYLLLDMTQPMHIALVWEEKQQYPTALLSLSSQQGIQGAENLSRNLKPYGDVLQKNGLWHGNIQLPRLPKASLSWEGTQHQILIAWRPFPSQIPFPISSFAASSKPTENIIRINTKHSPFQNTLISKVTIRAAFTPTILQLDGSGTWNHTPTPKPSHPPELIAGWNIPGIEPLQIYKSSNSTLCIAGTHDTIQKHLGIQNQCPISETSAIFVFFSQDFFTHIDIPMQHIEMSVWGTASTCTIQGNIHKKESRSLFPLYVWLHSMLMSI